jgi:Uma2 family endonuclease
MSTISVITPTLAAVPVVQPSPKMWTRSEVYRLMDEGWFEDQQIELIDGEIILLPTQIPEHAYAVDEVYHVLDRVFAKRYWVRMQLPIATTEYLEAAPDVSVVPGSKQDYVDHPATATLIVEVSKSTLDYDRTQKAGIYASAGVVDYWILNLKDRVLEVYRNPVAEAKRPFGHCYGSIERLDVAGHVSPLARPEEEVAVRDLLPPESIGASRV